MDCVFARVLSTRVLVLALFPCLCATSTVLLLPARARAGEAGANQPVAERASDEDAASRLSEFKVAFKAKGLKGEERIYARVWALEALGEVQHPDIVDALAKHTRDKDPHIRTAALDQLGKQQAFPGYAGQAVLKAVQKHRRDATFVLAGMECIARLRYLGASDWLVKCIKRADYAMTKRAVETAAKLEDPRLVPFLVDLLKKLRIEKGFSWDGYEVSWATGSHKDVSKEKAEQIKAEGDARAKAGKAKAAKGRQGSTRDMGAHVLRALRTMTQKKFTGGADARAWLKANEAQLQADVEAIQKRDEAQRATAKALKSRRRRK